MVKQLFCALANKYAGRPILVIGGGPSVTHDLPRIPDNYVGCVISANQHGFKQDRFKVDYVTCVDFTMGHSRKPMSEELGQYGVPSITRWSWATYRLPNAWSYSGDTGMTGIAIAAALGGHPVLFTGLDRNIGDRKYFWQGPPDDPVGWERRRHQAMKLNRPNMLQSNQKLVEMTKGAQVRTMSGPLRGIFKTWDINEKLPPFAPTTAFHTALQTGKLYYVQAARLFLHPTDPIPQGTTLMLTDNEARAPLKDGRVRPA